MTVSDICDDFPEKITPLDNIFTSFGGKKSCEGIIRTVKIETDNEKVIEKLKEPGKGQVLFVVADDKRKTAIVGDRLATIAINSGWEGIVVDGAVRDTGALAQMEIFVAASAIYPIRGARTGGGEIGVDIEIAGQQVAESAYCYADSDGIVISTGALK